MKSLRKILAVTVLTLVLACSSFAGEMGAGVVQPPPPQRQSASITGEMSTGNTATAETTVAGEMGAGVASTLNPVTEIMLSLLQSVLALF